MREAVRAAEQALAPTKLPMKVFPEVEARARFFLFWQFAKAPAKLWQKRLLFCNGHTMSQDFSLDGSPRFHRPVLAIVGGTRLGKSMLAADILDRIARRLGLPGLCMVFGGGHGQKRIGYKPSV